MIRQEEISHKISFPSHNQVHVVQTLSFKMIYYRVLKSDIINFFCAFQHFHDHISVDHDENLHMPNLT